MLKNMRKALSMTWQIRTIVYVSTILFIFFLWMSSPKKEKGEKPFPRLPTHLAFGGSFWPPDLVPHGPEIPPFQDPDEPMIASWSPEIIPHPPEYPPEEADELKIG